MTTLQISILEKLKPYLQDRPRPLIGAETVQILLWREVLDYTVLRTEESRELNSVHTPLSETHRSVIKRVAFLGSKQKAAESRQLESLLRSATQVAGKDADECYLKDNLCLECPRCGLYGASALSKEANIKHRIEYATAFSLLPLDQISEEITFNAVSELDQRTGQALGSRHVVKPATLFPSIVTLKSVTRTELVLAIKTLLSCKSYGAEARIGGDVRNTIIGVAAGWEEIITPLELTLELYDKKDTLNGTTLETLLTEKYKPLAGNPDRVTILTSEEAEALSRECGQVVLDRAFLDAAYNDIVEYRKSQEDKG